MRINKHFILFFCLFCIYTAVAGEEADTESFKEEYRKLESLSEKASLIKEHSSQLSEAGEEELREFLEELGELLNSEVETEIIETLLDSITRLGDQVSKNHDIVYEVTRLVGSLKKQAASIHRQTRKYLTSEEARAEFSRLCDENKGLTMKALTTLKALNNEKSIKTINAFTDDQHSDLAGLAIEILGYFKARSVEKRLKGLQKQFEFEMARGNTTGKGG